MPKTIKAIYEDGVFRPVNKPDIEEHKQVELLIVPKEDIITTPSSVLKVVDYLKKGPFPVRTPEDMGKDLEIEID